MEEDQRQFAARIAALAARIGPPDTGAPLEAFDRLKTLAEQAVQAEAHAQALTDRIEAAETARTAARQRLAEIDLTVAELAKAFPAETETGTLEHLRQAALKARAVMGDRAVLAERSRALLTLLTVPSVDAARAALESASQTGVQAALDEVLTDLATIETRYKRAIETRTAAEQSLKAIGGDADVARLTQRKAVLELEMQEAALRHLELSLGHRLAETAIRRYRDAHRSTMMQATETAFAALTNGAYTTLQTQIDGDTETLLALGAGGMAKQAQDMSKGTRFQLYLALRAAAYGQLADQGAALPFFCDDIFETFDEDRTRAACRLMAQIGRRGQAIYLTHHRHVVEIAREVCGDGVQVHRIAE
jgi:uncharacterized protein YhaN